MCCTREVVVECYDDTTERMENDSSNERMRGFVRLSKKNRSRRTLLTIASLIDQHRRCRSYTYS